jgi:Mrp family chromosome partitioning ATPase
MEKIWQAIERARATPASTNAQLNAAPSAAPPCVEIELSSKHLLSKRIVAHNATDQRSRPYDMLRTQALQSMEQHGWRILGVTSPMAGCGKTLTAINLAFSMARQEKLSVLLVDMDLRKPQIAKSLGFEPADRGLLDMLDQRMPSRDSIIWARAGNQRVAVLPTASVRESSERMGSRAMRELLLDLKKEHRIVIVDLPPVLSSDDVISILPQLDCVLLIAATGQSKASDVDESIRHLESRPLLRLVVNKATDEAANHYY